MSLLDELERLERAASKGPWEWKEHPDWGNWYLDSPSGRVLDDGSAGGEYRAKIDGEGVDAELIAAMRNSLPALLSVARAAELVVKNDDGHGGADCQIAALGRALKVLEGEP